MPESATKKGVGPCAEAPSGMTLCGGSVRNNPPGEEQSVGQPWMRILAHIAMRHLGS